MSAQLDPRVADILSGCDEYFIQQQIRWGEAITQGCFEQKNIYLVFEKSTMKPLFAVREESGDCDRCCCAPHHSIFAHFFLLNEAGDREVGSPFMTMEREGCDCCCGDGGDCPKPCICCFACKPECSHEGILYAGDFGDGAKPGTAKGMRDKASMLGETLQPINGGKFRPVLQVMDRGDSDEPTASQFAAIQGPRFFGGCSELCCDSKFGISKAKEGMGVDEIHKLTFDYATITKIRPKKFTQALREAFTDADLYEVDFQQKDVTPQQKANVLSAMILTDYVFFERDNDMCKAESNGVRITFFNCFCYGCVCPCSVLLQNNGGGGGGS